MTDPGKLRERVTLVRMVDEDRDGHTKQKPTAIGSRFARVEQLGGREFREASQVVAEASHRVTVWSDSVTRSLSTKDRLHWGNRVLEITSIAGDEDRETLIFLALERPDYPLEVGT